MTSQDRAKKRRFLHTVIRRLVEVPELAQQTEQQPSSLEQQIKEEPSTCEEDELLYPIVSLTEDSSEDANSRTDSEDLAATSLNLSNSSSHKRRLDRIPDRMSQLSEVGRSELVIPVTYNSRMARVYPQETVDARSPVEQERREKNTLAARQSRAKMRALDELLHKESQTAKEENARLKLDIAASFSYAEQLMQRLGMPTAGLNFIDVWDTAWRGEMGLTNEEGIEEEDHDKELSGDESKNVEDDDNEE